MGDFGTDLRMYPGTASSMTATAALFSNPSPPKAWGPASIYRRWLIIAVMGEAKIIGGISITLRPPFMGGWLKAAPIVTNPANLKRPKLANAKKWSSGRRR